MEYSTFPDTRALFGGDGVRPPRHLAVFTERLCRIVNFAWHFPPMTFQDYVTFKFICIDFISYRQLHARANRLGSLQVKYHAVAPYIAGYYRCVVLCIVFKIR